MARPPSAATRAAPFFSANALDPARCRRQSYQKVSNNFPLPDNEVPEVLEKLTESMTKISLLGPDHVHSACRDLYKAVSIAIDSGSADSSGFTSARAAFVTAARKVLHIDA